MPVDGTPLWTHAVLPGTQGSSGEPGVRSGESCRCQVVMELAGIAFLPIPHLLGMGSGSDLGHSLPVWPPWASSVPCVNALQASASVPIPLTVLGTQELLWTSLGEGDQVLPIAHLTPAFVISFGSEW